MSGECEKCGEHTVECECRETKAFEKLVSIGGWLSIKEKIPELDQACLFILNQTAMEGVYRGYIDSLKMHAFQHKHLSGYTLDVEYWKPLLPKGLEPSTP